jgi:murein DD-endopeptidase MepM/ murein hydrolase activator NlpD
MKLFLDYKKQFNIFLLFILLAVPLAFSLAQNINIEEIQEKIKTKDADIEQLEKEIASYQGQIDVLVKEKSSLSSTIKELDLTKKKLNADISITQKKIDKTNLKIQNLSSDINTKQSNIINHTNSIKNEIKKTNEYDDNNVVEILLSNQDFTSIWNDVDNIITVREKIREDIKRLREVKGELEDTKKGTILAKNELTKLKSSLSDQQRIVVQNTNEKNLLLKETKNNEANYQKLLKDRIARKDAFEKELREYESHLKFILDPSKLPGANVLSWPLEKVYVTQLFGKTVDAKRLYASGSHGGVDFRASVGTPVFAMADGEVYGVGNTDNTCVGTSFGKWVFIKYNNGLASTYGHLSLIKVNQGQSVKRGDVVGYSGNTGHTTGPHLHVGVYVASAVNVENKVSTTCKGKIYTMPLAPTNAYLDPMYYLPKYIK